MSLEPGLRVLVIGAHPDDCEERAGGAALRWRQAGCAVKFISMTDGSRGHYASAPARLREVRKQEAAAAAAALDVEYDVLEHVDGHLEPTLAARLDLIRRIRRFRPDLVITHRPVDYHPDHRYTAMLVQDSAYLVTVPLIAPDEPHLERNPVFAYLEDAFERPAPFRADIAVDIDGAIEAKWAAIRAHQSQFFEWLPYNQGILDQVPPASDPAARDRWLRAWVGPWLFQGLERYRDRLIARYGSARGRAIRHAEAFEISEYGRRPRPEELEDLFPL
jgi:LmbE family N-acetylglucosaminyl deacetylase